ncbi:ovoperoxidase [Apostichopus japonicus]|uniref:Ovoperoxidase n=1 Tax=Stichopus japonicus TaxID=307972 RepID=A0A2G8JLS7_STIJA|nr:ovoperoxidase [Apostichopus japonicus]
MLHVRNRRGTAEETSQEFLKFISEIESFERSILSPEIDDDERESLKRKHRRQLSKFCKWVGYNSEPDKEKCGKYRSIDGQCNNIKHPNWGKAGYPYRRLLPAKYNDRVSQPRWYNSSAREVSRQFVNQGKVQFSTYGASELVMHFGQFLDHDINLTPASAADCKCGNDEDEICFSIPCESDDPVCGEEGCIPFRRSRPTIRGDCRPGARAHENTITSFVDASNVYGSFQEDMDDLRDVEKGKGKMRVETQPIDEGHIHLLPHDKENEECIRPGDEDDKHCGKGGDVRAAEQPGLTSLHTMFVREHNRVVNVLNNLHENWDEDHFFHETRRIIIALMQKITYDEFLPLVLGKETMDEFKLGSWNGYDGYDKKINPTLFNEFAAAFMRFGHSLIPERLKRVTSLYVHDDFPSIDLRSAFFNAAHMYETEHGSISSLLLGMISNNLLPVDKHFSKAITDHLFEDPLNGTGGIDLIALNIQRGRDHGLPAYTEYRRHCGLSVPESWEDLVKIIDEDTVASLRTLYSNVDKIDIFVGYIAENPKKGALVGETAACVLGKQFHNLKYGDRYWYENTERKGSLTKDQIKAIQQVTLARVICENVRVDSIQPAVFKVPDEGKGSNNRAFYQLLLDEGYPNDRGLLDDFSNHRVDCKNYNEIPKLSLQPWIEDVTLEESSTESKTSRSSGSFSSSSASNNSENPSSSRRSSSSSASNNSENSLKL